MRFETGGMGVDDYLKIEILRVSMVTGKNLGTNDHCNAWKKSKSIGSKIVL